MIDAKCFRCGAAIQLFPSRYKRSKRHFCSKACNMKTINEDLNPGRMTPDVKTKLRKARLGSGAGKSYAKTYGRHTHRVAAEQMLGRPLLPGEIVHHKDRDRRNNAPENLVVFSSQSEHAKEHKLRYRGKKNDIQTA